MADFGTNYGEKFARSVLKIFFERSVADAITNNDYEGEIKGGGADRVNILTLAALSLKNYVGSALSPDTPTESEAQLVINVKRAYYFKIQSWSKFISYVNDPTSTLIETAGKTLAEEIDAHVLAKYSDVAAGNRVGTNADDATTITITVTTGAFVVAGGTPVASTWVGRGIKAVGHTKWYRVASVSSNTEGVIEDDLDDVATQYTGGAIAGASYVVEAIAKLQVAYNTLYGYILNLKEKLDENKVPQSDRWLVVPSKIASVMLKTSELIPAVATAYEDVVKRGLLGYVAGFKIYQNEQVYGNNTDGYRVLAGHKSWCTFAIAFTESGVEDLIGDFGKAYKGLTTYGSKVADERRKCAAEGWFYV